MPDISRSDNVRPAPSWTSLQVVSMDSSFYESAWNWLQRKNVLKWSGYAITALSVLWSGLTFLVAKDELHLLVWVDQSTRLCSPARALSRRCARQ